MIDPTEVSAALVTRGNVDLTQIIDTITDAGITDIVVWDNGKCTPDLDVSCYGRYVAIDRAKHDVIYFQDDDLIAPVTEILDAYDPEQDRHTIVANNRADEEWRLIGLGSLFHRDLADCFDTYIDTFGFDDDFCRVSDVVFAYQHEYRKVTLGYEDLPWASDPDASMYLQAGHMAVRERALKRTLELPERAVA